MKKQRNILVGLWFSFFIINGLLILWLYSMKWIGDESLVSSLKELNITYSPYLAVMIAFFWKRGNSLSTTTSISTAFHLGWIGSTIWNGLISMFIIRVLLEKSSIEESLALIHDICNMFGWIVSGAIGYYFAET